MQNKEENMLSCLQVGGLMDLEKQLICPICLEIFSKPVVILPCQHNLCRKCANELYQPSLFQARTTMTVNSGRFRCPACNQEVVLDRHGVYGLQRNLLVENIIDVYKQEVSSSVSPSPAPLPPQGQLTCAEHEGEKMNIYCLTCLTPTCSLCKVFGSHQTCEVRPLTDICQHTKDELREAVCDLTSSNNKLQAVIDELERSCRNIQENCRLQQQLVSEKFSHMVSILQDRQKVMTQRISSEEEERTGHAQSLARCYGNSMEENSKLMERVKRRLEEEDMAAFVQNSRELITKVLAASTSCSYGTLKEGFDDLNLHSYNFREQEEALRNINFLKVLDGSPEEPENVEGCEEVKDLPEKNLTESKQCLELSLQNIDNYEEPPTEMIPLLISPPVEPVEPLESVEPTVLPSPATGSLLRPSEEIQAHPGSEDFSDDPSDQNKEEEEEEEKEAEQREVLTCASPRAAACEQEDGMSTQQAVTLLFYILAFLVLLQRVWSYIGCFICT
ncbi:tripartite motif-containing protein 54-like [Gouania willdenowi]|uniref:tripartite motif-containing protein 54-like n=1 Tax=Gouania willdenowi TaxID=441366 RepID=UPI0010547BE2|nr:tripartite motif-containing protein 54-like [Gouania willdenowi]